ncbi:unnamed protein product [Musa acuminata var. zebrina]
MHEMEKKMKKKRMAARTTSLKIGKRQLCHGKCSRYSLPDDLLVQILSRLPVKSTSGSAAFPKSGLPSSPIAARTPSDTYVRPCAASSIDEATSQGPGSTRPSTLLKITASISTSSSLIYLTIAT